MDEKFLKPYNPAETEDKIYKLWEESGFFNPNECIKAGHTSADAEKFSIVLPPPNVTGTLHTGHAAMLAIEDIVVRYQRMSGKKTLWIPGTDHAAIATQSKVEKLLEKEKIRKHDLGREEFLKRVDDFAKESHDTIVNQVKKMGSSVDWSREAFTLDEKRELAVRTAFKKMYDDGLIYQGERIVNWDPKGQTTISDDEIIHEERDALLYTFKYSKDFPIPIATTRPETKVGDTAVAVHPEDERYKKFIGETFELEFCGVPLSLKIIGDKEINPEFGTGAVGVTPAHSQTDFQIAERHNIPSKKVINEYAKMIDDLPKNLAGKKVLEARETIVDWLKSENLMISEDKIKQNVQTAERTGAIIEPLPKLQWWIAVDKKFPIKKSNLKGIKDGDEVTLKQLMQEVVINNQVNILPERFEKIYFNWINNLRDWCISRQIWYGHQIPVWYKGDEIYVGVKAPEGDEWAQDTDTLDTWFSSGLWTFSTLGWPEDTEDFKTYHPTNLLETGYDILFFWVARMILMSTYLLGEIPFETVYLHGLVRDEKGRKMSKSLGNIIDPVDLINEYGADALRLSLIVGIGPGSDSNLGENKVKAYKKFANKLWNISRFVIENTENIKLEENFKYCDKDFEILNKQKEILKDVTDDIENYRLYLAGEKLYHYVWHEFADKIIEDSKKIFEEGSEEEKESRKHLLSNTLVTLLKVLHPFTPFVTEEIWQLLPYNKDTEILMVSKWPKVS